jgi:Ca2+-binding EF-hand superfamily protein
MKKIMLGLTAATIALVSGAPAFANEPAKKTHKVTEVVGYVKTETIVSTRDAEFAKADRNGDGMLSFKEFADAAMLENEYMMFNMNDTNSDGVLDINEYRNFSKQGPARVKKSFSRSGTNDNLSATPIH